MSTPHDRIPTIEDYAERAKQLDGLRRHKLLTKELGKATPRLYDTDGQPLHDKTVTASLFSPYSGARWLIVEVDPETGNAFGWCAPQGHSGELGYVNVHELGALAVRFGGRGRPIPAVERDKWFTPITLAEAAEEYPELDGLARAVARSQERAAATPDVADHSDQVGLDL